MIKISHLINTLYVSCLDLCGRKHGALQANSFHIDLAMKWLCLAQDSTQDNGVSEGYHLLHGWLPSYPETTGYIIETFFDYAKFTKDESIRQRALLMADWLIAVQNDDGSIPDSYFSKKMVFDTGQVLFGLVQAYVETKNEKYRAAAVKAGGWLVDVQQDNGCWTKYAVDTIPHTYYSRVAWSLAKLHSISTDDFLLQSCKENITWAVSQQNNNGWFNSASFNLKNHIHPYTHTIAYTIRGILESGLYLKEKKIVDSAQLAMDSLIKYIGNKGKVAGTYDKSWQGNHKFSCLTGNSQLAIICLKFYQFTGNDRYLSVAKDINRYQKEKQELRIKNKMIYGAIAGSFPVWGRYIHFTYPNWAVKFFIESLMLEDELTNCDGDN